MGTWLIGQKGGSAQAPKRGKTDVHAWFSLPLALITMTAQTSHLREQSSLILQCTRFAYAATIIVVYNNYRCIVSALKISVFL